MERFICYLRLLEWAKCKFDFNLMNWTKLCHLESISTLPHREKCLKIHSLSTVIGVFSECKNTVCNRGSVHNESNICSVIEETLTFTCWRVVTREHTSFNPFSMSSPFAFNSRNVRFVKYFTDSKEMTSNICKMRLFNCVNWDKNFKLTRDVSSEWTEGCWQINRVWRFATVESASNLENKSS